MNQAKKMLDLDAAIKVQAAVIEEAEQRMRKLLDEIAPLVAVAQVGQIIVLRTGTWTGRKLRVVKLVANFDFDRAVRVDHKCVVLKKDGTDSTLTTTARRYDGIEVQS